MQVSQGKHSTENQLEKCGRNPGGGSPGSPGSQGAPRLRNHARLKRLAPAAAAAALAAAILVAAPAPAYAMHISEGFLPVQWCVVWAVLFVPFFVRGIVVIRQKCAANSRMKLLLAMSAAYCFVLSALKLPSVTGSSSHPTGTGLGAVLFGPSAMSVLGLVVLLFQALLLAHGGLTTLGANAFSMAVVGPFVGYGFYKLASRLGAAKPVAVFLAAFFADLSTYCVTSLQLGLAFATPEAGIAATTVKFLGIFAVTQLPLAVVEGIFTVVVFTAIQSFCSEEFKLLGVLDVEKNAGAAAGSSPAAAGTAVAVGAGTAGPVETGEGSVK